MKDKSKIDGPGYIDYPQELAGKNVKRQRFFRERAGEKYLKKQFLSTFPRLGCIPGFILVLFILSGCQTISSDSEKKYPVELKWVRHSVEYRALCLQTYQQAWRAVKSRAASLKKDWAVVLDVDETALDNSRYQEILYEENKEFNYYWDGWVKEENCPPVPGVKAFIDSVRSLGEFAHIVYITNRNQNLEEATLNNLKKVDLWQEGDVLMCQKDRSDTKEIRRNEVITGTGRCQGMGERVIIALIGDQLGDMELYPEDVSPENYKEYYQKTDKWGIEYFMLPNPMYGYWERGYKR